MTPWELNEVIDGKKIMSDFPIVERKNESLYFYDMHGNEEFLAGEESRKMWNQISPQLKINGLREEIIGMTGSKGYAKGVVRIIMDPNNSENFQEGDILVTGMTRPDFLSLMKKAAAFITDEGGITCHAAIVSRELKKPCIIGTKIATKVLKDGDLVEVNADKGVVKIIKSNEIKNK